MAKYAYDKFDRVEDLFVIDEEKSTIYVTKPMTGIRLHRELCDIFDQPERLMFEGPTLRITDDHIQVHHLWTIGNPEVISGRLEHLFLEEREDGSFWMNPRLT